MGSGAHLPVTFGLDGRVAVVIGGTGALGATMAAALASAGARTVVVGRDEERGARVAESLRAHGDDVVFAQCDVSSRDELRALVERVLGSHGRIDVLVNGAGANSATPFLEIDDEELERLVAVNQLAVMRACQEFGRYFVERATATGEGASIINVGSDVGPHSALAGVHLLDDEGGRAQPDPEPRPRVGPARDPLQRARARVLPGRAEPGDPRRPSGSPRSWPTRRSGASASPTSSRARRCCSRATPDGSSPAPSSWSTAASRASAI